MSEFGKLEGDAEQYAKDHPQQVHEGEQDAEHAVESKFGGAGQDQGAQQNQGDQQDQADQQNQGNQQNQGDNSGQDKDQ